MKCKPESERFWSMVDKEGNNGCWLWTGGKRGDYGFFTIDRDERHTTMGAHRYAYLSSVGPIPEGLQLDHLCRNPPCVNPGHLEPVTIAENLRRGHEATGTGPYATHCIHGHEFTPENTYHRRDRPSRGCRICRTIQATAATQRKIETLGPWSQLTVARERRGLTKVALAKIVGLPSPRISCLESGRIQPTEADVLRHLVRIIPLTELASAA